MILKTLWIQRICGYEGEYKPECLCAVDEFSYDEYPINFDNQCTSKLDVIMDVISAHKIIDIEVDQNKIADILNNITTVEGYVG